MKGAPPCPKGGAGDAESLLIETHPCMSFDLPWVEDTIQMGPSSPSGMYSPECDTNNCPSGCCRVFTQIMYCDMCNQYPQLPVRIRFGIILFCWCVNCYYRHTRAVHSHFQSCPHSFFSCRLLNILNTTVSAFATVTQPLCWTQRTTTRRLAVISTEMKLRCRVLVAHLARFAIRIATVAAT
jgi:hypothetical protein